MASQDNPATRLPAEGFGLADVRSTSPSYFFLGGATASLNAFARRNFTTVLAGIWMASPVWGLRPVRALGAGSRGHPRLGIDSVSTRILYVRPIHIAPALLH